MNAMDRTELASIATQTLAILERGAYDVAGRTISIRAEQGEALAGTTVHSPDDLARLRAAAPPRGSLAAVEITGETTLAAARRLIDAGSGDVACLNFASATSPGGGFLTGARAQEEGICRCSGLYPTLLAAPDYYTSNLATRDICYTDWAIHSPRVPVFRGDDLALLERPFTPSFLTMPAPNLRTSAPSEEVVVETFRRRIESTFGLALAKGHRALVLGAWGCGAFRNDPALVARAFRWALDERAWRARFERVVFAVYDAKREGNLAVFERELG